MMKNEIREKQFTAINMLGIQYLLGDTIRGSRWLICLQSVDNDFFF